MMDINTAINLALEGNAILFAGSGFSYGAKNLNGEDFHTGDGLRDIIAKDCGTTSLRPLSIVSEFYISKRSDDDLIELLKREFTLSSIEVWHKIIMSIQWKRIYTTNYDSVIETAATGNSKKWTPTVLSKQISNADINSACIHLNGHIDYLDRSTLNNEFKLIDKSYECEELEGNEWFDLFKGDLQSAKAIIIIGYSMQYDINIKRLLGAPAVREKVLFIDASSLDPIDEEILKKHGTCEFIGIQGFADKVKEIQKTFVPSLIDKEFYSFLHEYRETLVPCAISFSELNNFYREGIYKDALSQKNHGEYQYLLLRTAVNIVVREYRNKKVFLATSDLGNGKTIFCQLVRNELRNCDVDVFFFNHEYVDCDNEIQRICSNRGHSVVIIDDYRNKLEILKRFKYNGISRVTFVLTARKAVNPSYRVLIDKLGISETDIRPLYLDTFDPEETEKLSYIIADNKLYTSDMTDITYSGIKYYIQSKCHCHFADMLLDFYESSDIKRRISDTWSQDANNSLAVKRLAILSLMKSVMGIDFNFTEMLNLLKLDYAAVVARESQFINEFFNINENDVVIKSSIVARELLKSVIGLEALADTMKAAIIEADKEYRVSGRHFELLKNLVSHSHFRLFKEDAKSREIVFSFYDNIRNLTFCEDNTFFWEQFASACIEARDFNTANQCIENAFAIAKRNPKFIPYHIETIKARYILEKLLFDIITGKRPSAEEAICCLKECHERLMKHFDHPDNNVGYVFRVASKYVDVFNNYEKEFDRRQKSIFTEKKVQMLKRMKEQLASSEVINVPLNKWVEELEKCVF